MNTCIAKVPTEKTDKDNKRITKITRNHWRYVILPCLCNTELDESRKKNQNSLLFVLLEDFFHMTKLCLVFSKRVIHLGFVLVFPLKSAFITKTTMTLILKKTNTPLRSSDLFF